MTLLTGGAGVGFLGEGVDERQVVSLDGEGCPLNKMAKCRTAASTVSNSLSKVE